MEGENTCYPGQANYVGPKRGWFSFIHHDVLVEWSRDITIPLEFYATGHKPAHEMPTRLRCLVHLTEDELPPEFGAFTRTQQKDNKEWEAVYEGSSTPERYEKINQEYEEARKGMQAALTTRQDEILEIIRRYVPDLPWENGALVFPKEASSG